VEREVGQLKGADVAGPPVARVRRRQRERLRVQRLGADPIHR